MLFVVFTVGAAFGFLVVANMIVKSQGQSYWEDEQEQEGYSMRRMTFLLFQLFLAICAPRLFGNLFARFRVCLLYSLRYFSLN